MAENQIRRASILLNIDEVDDNVLDSAYGRLLTNFHYDGDACWLSNYARNKNGHTNKLVFGQNNAIHTITIEKGYPKIRLITNTGQRHMVFAHHLSFVYANRDVRNTQAFREKWEDPAYDISHRCGKPKCFCPTDLIIEHHHDNVTRDYCHGLNKPGICPHNPPCKIRSL